ncbi:alpha-(1,6)-fucosyltransferase-like [Ciona intestinalis]
MPRQNNKEDNERGSLNTSFKLVKISKTHEIHDTDQQQELARELMKDSMMLKQLLVSYHMQQLTSDPKSFHQFQSIAKSLQDIISNHIELLYSRSKTKKTKRQLKDLNEVATSMIKRSQQAGGNCAYRKILFCDLKEKCGLGCTLHHYAICLFIAIGTYRTMVWDLRQVPGYPGLGNAILNLSPCQNTIDVIDAKRGAPEWKASTPTDLRIVKITKGLNTIKYTRFAPYTIPNQFLPRIKLIHAEPDLWWMGHVMSYLVRPTQRMKQEIEKTKTEIHFQHPVVGIHVRRTDKIQEIGYQPVDAYMEYVKSWYNKHIMRNGMWSEGYPDYTFIHLHSPNERSATDVTFELVKDVFLLRDCDYIVVTFSSNIGRLVHELRQTSERDETFEVANLDQSFHANGMWPLHHEAVFAHQPQEPCELPKDMDWRAQTEYTGICEMTMLEGDLLLNMPVLTRGVFLGGKNLRSGKIGMYPAYKVVTVLEGAPYPIMNETYF